MNVPVFEAALPVFVEFDVVEPDVVALFWLSDADTTADAAVRSFSDRASVDLSHDEPEDDVDCPPEVLPPPEYHV